MQHELGSVFILSAHAKARIIVHAGSNTPASRREFEQFPPVRFPIRLHFLFSSREKDLACKLKTLLSALPKSKARYRKTFNRYTGGVSFRCYFNDVATMQPVAWELKDENLWKGLLLQDDERVSPQDLIDQARQAVRSRSGAMAQVANA